MDYQDEGRLWNDPLTVPRQPALLAPADLVGPLTEVAAPGLSVVSLPRARKQCRIPADVTEEDDQLTAWLVAAQAFCEQEIYGSRQIGPATYDLPLMGGWRGELPIPRPPLQALSVSYYDASDALQTLAATVYEVRTPVRQPGTIALLPNQTWPTLSTTRRYPVTIRFAAGYLAPVTVDATMNAFTSTGRAFTNTQRVKVWSVSGTVPAPLVADTNYWVVGASGQTFQLAVTAGGSAIDLTDAGTGLLYVGDVPALIQQAILLLAAYFFDVRLPVLTGPGGKETEFAVTRLLGLEGWGSYR